MKFQTKLSFAIFAFVFATIGTIFIPKPAAAAYDGGNLIDDAILLNSSTMSANNIQDFLTNMGSGLAVRTFYFDCAATDASETYYRNAGAPCEQTVTASKIIYYASQIYGINPQVILATVQKEQSLVTTGNPTDWQINHAMGYGCPTTGVCISSDFLGQIDNGVWTLRLNTERARGNMTWWFTATRPWVCNNETNFYKPNLMPGQNVDFYDEDGVYYRTHFIASAATSAFYCYTPHAYNNPNGLYGLPKYGTTGRYYSGSYNFVYYFERWFGSTHAINGSINLSKSITTDATLSTVQVGDTVTASYEVSNSANYTVSAGGLGICARINGENYDFGFNSSNSIPANGTITISFSKTINKPGAMTLFACSYNDSLGGWASSYYPYNINGLVRSADITVKDNPLMSSGVTVSPSSTVAGESVVATVSIQNLSNNPMNIGLIAIAARDPNGNNVDFPADSNVTIPANSTYTYSKTRTFSKTGSYTFYVTNYKDNVWNESYPKSSNSSIIRSGTFIVKDNPLIISGVSLSQTTPAIGQSTTASMAIQNNSSNPVSIGLIAVAARDPNGNNVDFPADSDVTIPANSTYTYAKTRTFSNVGSYTFYVTNYKDNAWNESYPKSSSNSVARRGNFVVKDNPLVTSDVVMSPSNPASGQPVTISTTIQNLSDNNINIGLIAVAARDPNGNNVDFPADSNVTIPANSTYTYSKTRTFNSIGKYTFFLTSHNNGIWNENYPKSSNSSIIRSGTFIVKDNPLIVSGITIAPLTQGLGQTVTATMSIQNLSANSINMGNIAIAVRDPNGKNVDFLPDLNVNVAANSTYTYSKTSSFLVSGKYYFFVSSYINNEWNLNYPKSSSNSVIRSGFFNIN